MGSCATPVVCPTQRTRLQLVVKYWGTIVPVALQSRGHSIFQLRNTEKTCLVSFRCEKKSTQTPRFVLDRRRKLSEMLGRRKCRRQDRITTFGNLSSWGVSAPHTLQTYKNFVYENPCWEIHGTHVEYVVHSPAPQLGPTPNGKVVLDFSPLEGQIAIDREAPGG